MKGNQPNNEVSGRKHDSVLYQDGRLSASHYPPHLGLQTGSGNILKVCTTNVTTQRAHLQLPLLQRAASASRCAAPAAGSAPSWAADLRSLQPAPQSEASRMLAPCSGFWGRCRGDRSRGCRSRRRRHGRCSCRGRCWRRGRDWRRRRRRRAGRWRTRRGGRRRTRPGTWRRWGRGPEQHHIWSMLNAHLLQMV